MDHDFSEIFARYEALRAQTDSAFLRVSEAHPDCVACKSGCADCCHALFDLSFIEALYINSKFNSELDESSKGKILERADQADRKIALIKKEAYQAVKKGREADEVLSRVAWERVRCPLLGDDDRCALYEHRPITCRLYGIPTSIGGKAHTCGMSGFAEGTPYPTANLDAVHGRLLELSTEIVKTLPTKYIGLTDMLVPLSMALLTIYNDEYLGIRKPAPENGEPQKAGDTGKGD
ncbi:MAG: YkgJ family cysteine cluster protein [Deltaproteobacteria bacterium]|nr:YkgJ family cysteine cluster protein [Deltaproteobacteria bacterium]